MNSGGGGPQWQSHRSAAAKRPWGEGAGGECPPSRAKRGSSEGVSFLKG